jgi:hypothetical protein
LFATNFPDVHIKVLDCSKENQVTFALAMYEVLGKTRPRCMRSKIRNGDVLQVYDVTVALAMHEAHRYDDHRVMDTSDVTGATGSTSGRFPVP